MNSSIILSDTQLELNVVGNKFRADGFAGGDGLHTVGFYLNEFIGRLFIQGSLVLEPTNDDWFNIIMEGEDKSYLQFDNETNGLIVKNFTGNFVWVRAKVDRSHILNPDPESVGSVVKIVMNH